MALISWSSELSVEIPAIDNQHRQLIDLINQLHDAMRVGKGHIELYSILDQLILYTETHFSTEEKLMQQAKFPDYLRHKRIHEQLTAQVREIKQQVDQRQVGISIKVINFLKEWVTNHIQKEDLKYKAYVQ